MAFDINKDYQRDMLVEMTQERYNYNGSVAHRFIFTLQNGLEGGIDFVNDESLTLGELLDGIEKMIFDLKVKSSQKNAE